MNTTENQKIMVGIRMGDEKILNEFYRKNLPYSRKYIIQNSGSEKDVEDIFQDALVLIYQKLQKDSLALNCSIRTYFYAICKNMWYNKFRKDRKKTNYTDRINTITDDSNIILTIEKTEKERIYHKYFCKLNESSRKVLTLFYEGKSMREIAIITGYTEKYARKKKFEAKKLLIAMLQKDPVYNELKLTSDKINPEIEKNELALVG